MTIRRGEMEAVLKKLKRESNFQLHVRLLLVQLSQNRSVVATKSKVKWMKYLLQRKRTPR
jgi:hypothetical protein